MLEKLKMNGRNIYAINSFWMISDRIANLVSAFVWSIILARSLNISDFGTYNSVTSSVAIFLPIAAIGLNGLLSKLLLDKKESLRNILLTGIILKVFAGIICCILVNLWFYYSSALTFTQANLFYSVILIIHCIQVYESFNQSFCSSQLVSLCRFISVTIFLIAKVTLWFSDMLTLDVALYIQALEFFVYFSCLFFVSRSKYSKVINENENENEKYSLVKFKKLSKIMLSGGGLLVVSGVAETINLKIDVLMLTELSNLKSVSIYSVATKFSESGYFFAAAIATSYFPKMMSAKSESKGKYYGVITNLAKKLLLMCFFVFVFTAVLGYPAIYYLYGIDYIDSYYVLIIHLCASFFVYFRAVFSKWIIAEQVFKYSILTHLCGGLVNVALNMYLIPNHSYYGAAIATIISYSFSSYFSLLFFKDTRFYLKNLKFHFIGRLEK